MNEWILDLNETELLLQRGLELKSTFDDETEQVYYYIDGINIDPESIIYYKTAREAYDASLYMEPKFWPSKEIMDRHKFMNHIFHKVRMARMETEE